MSTTQETSERRDQIVVDTFRRLGVECDLVGYQEGPQICRAEIKPGEGVRMMDFRRLSRADDLAYAIGARSVRISAPIPGKSAIGVEWDRKDRQVVEFDDLPRAHYPPMVSLGVDVENRPILLPITDAPHCLCAGATGSGKTTALHTIICGLVSELGPEKVKLCLVDPKRVEFSAYESLPHLLFPVADDARKAIQQLHALALNMDDRYRLLQVLGARDIREANARLIERGADPLPYFVCVVDELAELMMASRKEVEGLIVRICQKGRAAGLHMILATQTPRVDVISGLIKVNIPTRIAFAVPTMTDSRVVLDSNGAESLLGRGDGLLSFAGLPATRFQGAYCSPERVAEVVGRWASAPMRNAETVE